MNNQALLKKKEILQMCAISNSTLYRLIHQGDFPAQVQVTGLRSVAWREEEVRAWIESRPKVRAAKVAAEEH